jgi:hypothetical protein
MATEMDIESSFPFFFVFSSFFFFFVIYKLCNTSLLYLIYIIICRGLAPPVPIKKSSRKFVGFKEFYADQKVGYGESANSIQNLPFFYRFSISNFERPIKHLDESDSSHSKPLQTLNDLLDQLLSPEVS